jgi:uncharacterized membrane protein
MDFISSNPKCPLEIVHESSVSHLTNAQQNSGLSYHLFALCIIGLLVLSRGNTIKIAPLAKLDYSPP